MGSLLNMAAPPTRALAAGTGDVRITGEVPDDGFGFAVARAGDVNADGFVDYVAGAYGDDNVAEGSGEAYLFYGPLTQDVAAGDADATVTGEAVVDGLGTTVSGAGDLNGDGFDDLMIGARSNDTNGIQAGRVYVFNGPLTGAHPALEADAIISGDPFDELGWSMAPAGDVNGDGFDDVLVGAWQADLVGQAFLFLGPLTGNLTEADAAASFTGVIFSEELGESVAAGDLNDDGVPDLILGAPRPPVNGEDPGSVYVFFGPVTGDFSATEADVIVGGQRDNDEFGTSVAAGDVDGDGADDLIVGARQLFQLDSDGRAYVFSGPLKGRIAAHSADAILVGEDSDPVDDDLFGSAVAVVGDTNGDDIDDVLVGAPTNYAAGSRSGRAYLFYGPLAGQIQAASADRIFDGSAFDLLGTTVASAGDANGDGLADLLTGAPRFSGTHRVGYASVFFGEGTPATRLLVTVTPVDPPIVIPPEGGSVRFSVEILNRSSAAVDFDLWTELERPGGVRTRSPRSLSVAAGRTVTLALRVRVAGGEPAGTYTLRGLVGTFPVAEDSDTFTFVKQAAPGAVTGLRVHLRRLQARDSFSVAPRG